MMEPIESNQPRSKPELVRTPEDAFIRVLEALVRYHLGPVAPHSDRNMGEVA